MIFKKIFCALIILGSFHAFGQKKMPPFNTLDSVKKAQKESLAKLRSENVPHKTLDSIEDNYKDIRDSLREEAHDYADSIMDHMDNCSHFELSADLSSNQYIYGRRGPASGMVGSPKLMYQHKVGIYASLNTDEYNLHYKQLSKRRLSGNDTVTVDKIESDVTLTLGYTKTFFDKWDVDVCLDHTFINYGNDKNYLATSLNVNTGFDFWGYMTANVYYTLLFGGSKNTASYEKKYSNILTFELLHDFKIYRFLGAKVFTISPEVSTDVGNDNLIRNRLRARNVNGGLSDQIDAALADNFFGLLNIEGSLNIDYRIKNLDIYVNPRVAIPFNVVPANAIASAPYRTNTTKGPVWYVNVGIKYLFKFWKEKK